ncbi:MAG: helix-turn-helix transcriptional regulator [Planctomycetes bacterium]|nr:helix-turn-helix transcriptional regulator [Planctomycetota bacterium]
MKSAGTQNAALRKRLNKLADRFPQIEIARRTGVAPANVHRYLRAGRIPAEFCLALVEAFDLSPDWLLKGEGEPITSDLKADTAAKAGDLLDLVKAMNAVARMRLGAVVGDRDRHKLRELSETLQTFDRLKERMNDRTRPVLARLLDDLGQALAGMDIARARVLRETAVELSRLCTDDTLLERLDTLQSGVEYLTGQLEPALEFDRRVFARRVRDGRLSGDDDVSQLVHLVMSLRETGRIAEARRVCGAILSLMDEQAVNSRGALEMRIFMGSFHVELGDLEQGLAMLREAYPRIPRESRIAGTILMARALMLAGVMDYFEAHTFGYRTAGGSRLLMREACFREDPAMLAHAARHLIGTGEPCVPHAEYDAQRTQLVQRALEGKGRAGDFQRMAERHPPVTASRYMRDLLLAVHAAQHARLLGDRRELKARAEQTHGALAAIPPEIHPPIELTALHLKNAAALGKTGPWPIRTAGALKDVSAWVQRGYAGLAALQ